MTKTESKVYPGIPIGIILLEEKNVADWQENSKGWTPFQRDVLRRLQQAAPENRTLLVDGMTKISDSSDFATIINWTIIMAALSQPTLDRVVTAINLNEASGVYPKKKYRSPFGVGRVKLAWYKFLNYIGK